MSCHVRAFSFIGTTLSIFQDFNQLFNDGRVMILYYLLKSCFSAGFMRGILINNRYTYQHVLICAAAIVTKDALWSVVFNKTLSLCHGHNPLQAC